MKLVQMAGTCSMYELVNVDHTFINKPWLRSKINHVNNRVHYGPVKVIIVNLNTRMSVIKQKEFEKRTGFKLVYSYYGNSGPVQTFMLKTKDL